MAYTTATLNRIAGGAGSCPQLWIYTSADAHGTIDGADYFDDGSNKGMKINDCVIVVDTATPTLTVHRVSAVTAGGAATIGAATLS
jgi:hypothetical protein